MTGDFLPRYMSVPTSKGFRPSYKLFTDKPERFVPFAEGPRYFESSDEAKEAAADYVRARLNTPIEACTCEPPDALDEVAAWRQRKAEEAELERIRAFGPDTVRNKNGRQVEVVVRRVGR